MRLSIILLILCALASTFGSQVIDSVLSAPVTAHAEKRPQANVETSEPEISGLYTRALFAEGLVLFRTPTPPADYLAKQKGLSEFTWTLSGIVGSVDSRKAFFKDKSSGQVTIAAAGDGLGDWRVESIQAGCVYLRKKAKNRRECI